MKRSRVWAFLALVHSASWFVLWLPVALPISRAKWCELGLNRLSNRTFHALTGGILLLIAAITLGFIGHAILNKRLTYGMRAWWATALVLFNPIMTPAYWLLQLRRSHD